MFLQLYQGKVLYFRKNHGLVTVAAYKLILAAAAIARLAFGQIARPASEDKRLHQSVLVSRYRRLLTTLPEM